MTLPPEQAAPLDKELSRLSLEEIKRRLGAGHGRGKAVKHVEQHVEPDKFHNRHPVFRNGVWVWVYGPVTPPMVTIVIGCGRLGIITGSPYWWDRYYACVGYDYH